MIGTLCGCSSDLVPEPPHEGQAPEAGDVVGGCGTATRLVAGTTRTRATVFLHHADVTVATSPLRQLGTTPGRRLRDGV